MPSAYDKIAAFSLAMIAASPAVAQSPSDGIPPPGAQAAGYTTLAFKSDFTDPYFANRSNWLDCAGASSPQWFMAGGNGQSPPPCSRVSIVHDGGVQVLDIKFTAADAPYLGTVLATVNSSLTRGIDFPNGAYWEITYRILPAGRDNNPYGSLVTGFFIWSNSGQAGASRSFLENDFTETYASGCCHAGTVVHVWGDTPQGQHNFAVAGYGLPEYGVDETAYHTIAARVTQDGTSNLALCMYVNGQFKNCGDMVSSGNSGAAGITSDQLNQRNLLALQVGPLDSTPVDATIDMLVKDVKIWTCSNWKGILNTPGNACNGAVLTSAP
jgi:hypothetical protein